MLEHELGWLFMGRDGKLYLAEFGEELEFPWIITENVLLFVRTAIFI